MPWHGDMSTGPPGPPFKSLLMSDFRSHTNPLPCNLGIQSLGVSVSANMNISKVLGYPSTFEGSKTLQPHGYTHKSIVYAQIDFKRNRGSNSTIFFSLKYQFSNQQLNLSRCVFPGYYVLPKNNNARLFPVPDPKLQRQKQQIPSLFLLLMLRRSGNHDWKTVKNNLVVLIVDNESTTQNSSKSLKSM